jgi:8-oxo-dGTP pyrophosphatase MutT (NUDIX family)
MAISTMSTIICSGGLFLAKDTKRFLFLLRTKGKTAETWGFVGGKKEPEDTTPYDTLTREIEEEIGTPAKIEKMIPLEQYVSNDQHFKYNTYIVLVENEFIPTLNDEHSAYAWCDYNCFPKPLHKGVKVSLNNRSIKNKIEIILELI